MERIDTTTQVDTPERVGFRFRVAGAGQRGAAWAIDVCVQCVVGLLVVLLMVLAGIAVDPGLGQGAILVALFVITWFYAAIFEVLWSGRTPGKYLLGLRVVHGDGAPVSLRGAVLRNLSRAVDGLPVLYAVGTLTTLVDPRLRRMGDLVADTVVVVESATELMGGVDIAPPVTDVERRALPPKVVLSKRERRAIERLLHRRGRISKERLQELAGYLAPALSERTGVQASDPLRVLTLAYARATGRDG